MIDGSSRRITPRLALAAALEPTSYLLASCQVFCDDAIRRARLLCCALLCIARSRAKFQANRSGSICRFMLVSWPAATWQVFPLIILPTGNGLGTMTKGQRLEQPGS